MPARFAFRQIDIRDLATILSDGEIRSKSHPSHQACHQTSHAQIVGFRGEPNFNLPFGGVVNDYVPFYFSPVTAFTLVIHRGGVEVRSPTGHSLGMSSVSDRAFLVANVASVQGAGLQACFSDYALNSLAPMPTVVSDFALLPSHVKWGLFDEAPIVARIPEIQYEGVCQYFLDAAVPPERQYRKSARMAEFLVRGAFPTSQLCAIIAPNELRCREIEVVARRYGFRGLVLSKPGCFVS